MYLKEPAMALVVKSNQLWMRNITNVRSQIYFLTLLKHTFFVPVCYLGYGSPAKLLSSAIKKVISVPTELECKNECTRFRENTPFKCLAFSYG